MGWWLLAQGWLASAAFGQAAVPVAAVPVVYDGDDGASVVVEVAGRTGLPGSQLLPTPLDDLLAAEPNVLGDATIRRCSAPAPATNLELHAELVRAESTWATTHDGPGAMDHLDLVVTSMGCLGELVDPALAANAFALRGGIAAAVGELEMATGEIRTALAFGPELAWVDRWPAPGAAVLEEQRAVPPSAHLSVAPDDPASGPWLDGRELDDGLVVSPGLHLLQFGTGVGIRSAWVTIGGDATLVAPGNYRRPVLERVADPARRTEVEALLEGTLPSFQAAYVAAGGGLWLVAREGGVVSTIEIAAPPPPADETGRKKKLKKKDRKRKQAASAPPDDRTRAPTTARVHGP